MEKKIFPSELAYVLGLAILAFGTALMEAADFGVSMVVAPAYLLHLKVSEFWPFFSFGMAEYTLQAFLLVLMVLVVRRFKGYYLFSFVTAVIYGLMLDGAMYLAAFLTIEALPVRLIAYVAGMLLGGCSIALLFNTYIAPEVYELFVKEFAEKYGMRISRVKTVYDCISCAAAVLMSFAFFGLFRFEGIKLGTIVCALTNGWLIGRFSKLYERLWQFKDCLGLRKYFE